MIQDFRDLLAALVAADAKFLVVGAHALALHGVPRATGDLDVWVDTHDTPLHSVPANVATADGSDATTTQALANALKVKLNALLTALRG